MFSVENPNTHVDEHAMQSGHIVRPPEQLLQVSSSPVLERLGSPLEDGRDTKKHRSQGDLVSGDMLNESMETYEVATNGENGPPKVRPSYAKMAATLPQQNSVRMNLNSENEIEVPDEDCIVDESGPFPTIRFVQRLEYEGLNQICFSCGVYGRSMEGCPGMDKHAGESQENNISTHETDRFPSFSSKGADLYGPWMVVEDRRRRAESSNATGKSGEVVERGKPSSRFEVLEVEETPEIADEFNDPRGKSSLPRVPQESIIRNAAYMASNPNKKKKKQQGLEKASDSIVLPSIPGQRTTVFDREASSSKGVHKAVYIAEDGVRNTKAVGVKLSNSKDGVTWVQGTTDQHTVQLDRVSRSGIRSRIEEPPDSEGAVVEEEEFMDGSKMEGVDGSDERLIIQ
ncbi:hypothetical protein V6N12_001267 [Hibiscus sabdariffa]|uniref:Zinc knuckle CX2CX4HX4C domain-containing protein n=1 Tax=Hibiscus sabdariffa TaxID=183260 RepID=A0ABR2C6R1_9ROSI